jgi:hypothetical protein
MQISPLEFIEIFERKNPLCGNVTFLAVANSVYNFDDNVSFLEFCDDFRLP